MYIRLKIAVCAILLSATMFSCTKEEMVAEPLRKGPEIGFGVNLGWEADKIGTKSGYGKKQGEFVLRSSELEDTLAVGVYVQNGINLNEEPKTKGAVTSSGNLDKFGVWCQLTNGNNERISYFSNLEVSRDLSSGVCSSDTYYWPGSDFTKLEFLAVGPYAPEGLTPDNTILPTSFTYTVPEEAVDQTDIIIATPKYSTESAAYPGNYDTQINLNFNHILSAVNVKVGDIPGGGVINSVSIKNLHNAGTYTVATGAWTVTSESPTASYTIENTVEVNENTQSGTQINPENATFMLLPQTLTENAVLEVNFTHALTNNKVTLSGKIADITPTWTKGNSYNYLINIAPDYILTIEAENFTTADCHYDVREITISDDQNVGWTLSSNVDWVKFRVKPTNYETNGYKDYWIENHTVQIIEIEYNQATEERNIVKDETTTYPITKTLKGSGNTNILVYFYENTETSTNNIRETPIALSDNKGNEKDYFTVSQFYPLWSNNIAYERIEESDKGFPWGFASTRTVTYTYPDFPTPAWVSDWGIIGAIIYWLFGDWFRQDYNAARAEAYNTFYNTYFNTDSNEDTKFISMSGSENSKWSATLNYGNLNNIVATGNGLENTIAILGYTGGSTTGSDAETWLIDNGLTSNGGSSTTDNTTITQTAVYQAIKKNAWVSSTVQTTTTVISEDGKTSSDTKTINEVNLAESGIQWFLPSSSEVATLLPTACDDDNTNNDEALEGTYWSSTSATSPNSISYTAAGATATTSRTATHKVRAARSKN